MNPLLQVGSGEKITGSGRSKITDPDPRHWLNLNVHSSLTRVPIDFYLNVCLFQKG